MQSYPLQLSVASNTRTLSAQADLFVYESSSTVPDTGDARIVVKPDTGNEIVLRPGQAFRLQGGEMATNWNIKSLDSNVDITGTVIIGSGEFFDANKVTTVKLDGEFANNVNVNNTPAAPVHVRIDTEQIVNISGNILNYNRTYYSRADVVAAKNQAIVTAAENVAGVVLQKWMIAHTMPGAGPNTVSILAKATAPLSKHDGDVLFSHTMSTAASSVNLSSDLAKDGMLMVPPGLGVWLFIESAGLTVVTHDIKLRVR